MYPCAQNTSVHWAAAILIMGIIRIRPAFSAPPGANVVAWRPAEIKRSSRRDKKAKKITTVEKEGVEVSINLDQSGHRAPHWLPPLLHLTLYKEKSLRHSRRWTAAGAAFFFHTLLFIIGGVCGLLFLIFLFLTGGSGS